jgi:hypothetical protein
VAIGFAATALATTGGLVLSSAAHASSYDYIHPTSSSYIDEAAPTKTLGAKSGPYQVGAWHDESGDTHISRAYFTFDLSGYRGATIASAGLVMDEASANDCTADRKIALWQTATPTGKINWTNAPAESRKVFSGTQTTPACPWPYVEFDATSVITADLKGTGIFTIEVSIPGAAENNVTFGRALNSLSVELTYNHAPNAPTRLTVNGNACGTTAILSPTRQPSLVAAVTDPDINSGGSGQDPLSATFEIWPVGSPAQTTDYTDSFLGYSPATAAMTLPPGLLTDGGKYAFKVKANDGQADSKWSASCRLTVDVTGPTTAPTVSSTDYPEGFSFPGSGGPNVPGTFTFNANGDKSIVGFSYGEYGGGYYVAANKPGGTATVTITPFSPGPYGLEVAGMDKAGNRGPQTEYLFNVRDTSPTVTDGDPTAAFRTARTFTFTPNMDGVVSYEYYLNQPDNVQYVDAGPDGSAQVTLTPDGSSSNSLYVTSVTTTGIRSAQAIFGFYAPNTPLVTSDEYPSGPFGGGVGVEGSFTFAPAYPGVVSYTYAFDNGVSQTIAAASDGTATVRWTPTTSGFHELIVTSLDSSGFVSDENDYAITVNPNSPSIISDVYQSFVASGGPGQTGTFTFTSHQTAATEFVYKFGGDAQKTVPVGPDGTATVTWTPTSLGSVGLTVNTRDASGTLSDAGYFGIYIDQKAPTVTQTNANGVYTFTFTSVLAGSTTFTYTVDGGDALSVPVGSDGTATVTPTPSADASHNVTVFSTTATGTRSGTTPYYFYVSS